MRIVSYVKCVWPPLAGPVKLIHFLTLMINDVLTVYVIENVGDICEVNKDNSCEQNNKTSTNHAY